MLKRSVLSILGGAVLAGLLLLIPTAAAECLGHCDDLDGYTYVGCSIHMGGDGKIDVVVCGYTENPLDPEVQRLLNELMHIS